MAVARRVGLALIAFVALANMISAEDGCLVLHPNILDPSVTAVNKLIGTVYEGATAIPATISTYLVSPVEAKNSFVADTAGGITYKASVPGFDVTDPDGDTYTLGASASRSVRITLTSPKCTATVTLFIIGTDYRIFPFDLGFIATRANQALTFNLVVQQYGAAAGSYVNMPASTFGYNYYFRFNGQKYTPNDAIKTPVTLTGPASYTFPGYVTYEMYFYRDGFSDSHVLCVDT
eukprot:Opistho-2@67479